MDGRAAVWGLALAGSGCGRDSCAPEIVGGTPDLRREIAVAWDTFEAPLRLPVCVPKVALVEEVRTRGVDEERFAAAGAWRRTPFGHRIDLDTAPPGDEPFAAILAHEACHALDDQHRLVRRETVSPPFDETADWALARPSHAEAEAFARWCELGPDSLALADGDPTSALDREAIAELSAEVWIEPEVELEPPSPAPVGSWTPPEGEAGGLGVTDDGRIAVRGEGGWWALDPDTLAADWSTAGWPGGGSSSEVGYVRVPGWVARQTARVGDRPLALADLVLPSGRTARAALWGDPLEDLPVRAGGWEVDDALLTTSDGRVWQVARRGDALDLDLWR